ncbi:MAG: acylphosphatase [Syntrophobacter sp. DG_60]|nr:MAG: acylphosphatase [Syntrophobacter sp. DG_60]
MDKVRAHVIIEGRVQGVFFRSFTQDEAVRLGITGWVKNRRDGKVEAMFEGERDRVEEIIRWCHVGSPWAKVRKVDVAWETHRDEFKSFSVTY